MTIERRNVTRTTASVIAVALMLGLAVIGVAAQQQGTGGPGGGQPFVGRGGPGLAMHAAIRGMYLRGLRALELTPAQREQIKGAMQGHRDEFKAIAKDMIAARRALHAAVTADTIDEAAIRAASARVAEVDVRGALLRAKVHADVVALLTPEQQQKARTMRERAKGRISAVLDRLMGE